MHKLLLAPIALAFSAAAFAAAPVRLDVDAREAPRHILHARLQMEAKPGPLTLYYPKWIPGEHGPRYPRLERIPGTPDVLSRIIAPRTARK